jgi:hypothetical protein
MDDAKPPVLEFRGQHSYVMIVENGNQHSQPDENSQPDA